MTRLKTILYGMMLAGLAAVCFSSAVWAGETAVVALPTGTVLPFAGVKVPEGFLPCDGRLVSVREHPELYDAIGCLYGPTKDDDGNPLVTAEERKQFDTVENLAHTFRLPDFRGKFLRGADQDTGNDPEANSRIALGNGKPTEPGSTQMAGTQLPKKLFSTNPDDGGHDQVRIFTYNRSGGGLSTPIPTYTQHLDKEPYEEIRDGKHVHRITEGGDIETRPSNISINFIIKY